MAEASLTVSSKNYSSWSLRGFLLCRMAGLDFAERVAPIDDPATRAELLLLSPSFLVPCLDHGKVKVWDTLAIAEYLNELKPEAGLLPADPVARAHCRAVCGEMHSGFANLRSALPMNLKARHPGFKVWAGRAGRHRPRDGDLARLPAALWRALSVRQDADHGRRHVRPGVHALRHLRREARSGLAGLPRPDAGISRPWWNGQRRPRPSPRRSRSSTSSSSSAAPATQ